MDAAAIDALADTLLAARAGNRQITPISDGRPDFGLAEARAVARRIRHRRVARGERPVGRKIGFTNHRLWDIYGVRAPIWGDVFDTTLVRLQDGPAAVPLPALPEPKIEPEIVLILADAPGPGMAEAELVACIGGVAHGFEVVTSPFPGWRFAVADTQAAFGLHGVLCLGPAQDVALLGDDPAAVLAGLRVTLSDGSASFAGRGSDVLGGPVAALRHLVAELDAAGEAPLGPGDIVSTGTLTDARPLLAGARWRSVLTGLPIAGLDVTFTG